MGAEARLVLPDDEFEKKDIFTSNSLTHFNNSQHRLSVRARDLGYILHYESIILGFSDLQIVRGRIQQISHLLAVDLKERDGQVELDVAVGVVDLLEQTIDATRNDTLIVRVPDRGALHGPRFTYNWKLFRYATCLNCEQLYLQRSDHRPSPCR